MWLDLFISTPYMALSLSMKDNIRIEYFGLIFSKVLSVTSLLNFQNSINLKMSELVIFTSSNDVYRYQIDDSKLYIYNAGDTKFPIIFFYNLLRWQILIRIYIFFSWILITTNYVNMCKKCHMWLDLFISTPYMALSLSMKDNIGIEYFVLISSKVLSVTSLLNFQNSINLKMSELGIFTSSNDVYRYQIDDSKLYI